MTTCRRFKPLLELYRPGELSRREAEELAQHLSQCARCSAQFKTIADANRFIEQLRLREPSLPPETEMADAILARVSGRLARSHARAGTRFSERILGFIFSPLARYGMASLALGSVIVCLVQSAFLLLNLDSLEGRIASRLTRRPGLEVEYSVGTARIAPPERKQLEEFVLATVGIRENDAIFVAREAVGQFLGSGPGGMASMAHLASMLGVSQVRVVALANDVERHAIMKIHINSEGR